MRLRSYIILVFLLSMAAFACASGTSNGFGNDDAGVSADAGPSSGPPVVFPPDDPDDSGDPASIDDAQAPDDAPLIVPISLLGGDDAGAPTAAQPGFDAGPGGACDGGLVAGDLAIDELLVASIAGTGDHGEWLEVESTRGCALDLVGLHAECAVGSKVYTLDVTSDLWVPAGGTFVIADSTNAAVNNALPGLVLGWDGNAGDVLRNEGGTVSILAGGALVDSVTYPPTEKLVATGTSLAFPSDCPLASRATWSLWRTSQASWFPAFHGTPNAPNDDVHCPDD